MNVKKLLFNQLKKRLQYFMGRFNFGRVPTRYLPLLPCIYVDSKDITFEVAWIAWSFSIYLGNEKK
jgi:hypothetical protein